MSRPFDPPAFRSLMGMGEAARTVAGRYRLGAALGAGGCGEVFRARDLLEDRNVAIKLLVAMSTEQLARVRREVAALRIVRLPGVVRLLDDGVDDGDHFIVMDLVEGHPFPGQGADRSWSTVGPRTVRLLEALALVHSTGVIHRDLKPANVLVDETGRPTILDFGIARGPALGEPVTVRSDLVGTPRYLAPEQLCAHPSDVRADLYAVGVMLFEALTGRPPHPPDDLRELTTARVSRDAPPIHSFVPDLPRRVALVVDRLLARRPEDRPRSAIDVLADLGEEGGGGHAPQGMPRLGGDAVVDALVTAALAGRRLTIGGPRGSGRSRALRDAEERLLAAGRPVAWTTAGARPYESLAALGVLESTPTPAASRDVDPGPQLQRALAARFAEGLVLLVDGTDRLDRWSARLLADTPGPILGVGPEGQSIPDLTEEELRPLFHGPDRLLHLQEDGARELHARAGGRPSRLAAEVSAWVGAGLAEWSGGRLVVRRADLHRLASGLQVALPHLPEGERRARLAGPLDDVVGWAAMAWPDTTAALLEAVMDVPPWELHVEIDELLELGALRLLPDGRLRAEVPDGRGEWPEERRRTAYRRIAAALPAGNPRRFAHLVSAGDFAEAAAEAQALARRLEDEGQEGLAAGVLVSGLSVARQASGAPGEEALLELLATGALRAQSVAACERALYELGRATRPSERRTMLTRLLRGAVAHWRGRLDEAEAAVETVPEPDTEELGRWRQVMRVQLAAARGLPAYEALLQSLEPWSRGAPGREAVYTGWLGMLRYRQGRFDEAAELHLLAAKGRQDRPSQLASLLNAASAMLEAYRLEEAVLVARQVLELARAGRMEVFEARAEWVLRNAAWRAGSAGSPDRELVDAAVSLQQNALEAQICLTEAAVAWRAGALDDAARIAGAARATWTRVGFVAGAALAEALELLCGDEPDPLRVRALAGRALRAGPPRLTLQTLGLLGLACPAVAREWWPEVQRLASLTDPAAWGRRNEVLAVREAVEYCGPEAPG